jgi:hypothetical protein
MLGSALSVEATTKKYGRAITRPLAVSMAVLGAGMLERLVDAVHVTSSPTSTALDGRCGLLVKAFRPESELDMETDSEMQHLGGYFTVLRRLNSFVGARHKRWRHVGKLAVVDDSEARWMAGLATTVPSHAQYVTHVHHHHDEDHHHHHHHHHGDHDTTGRDGHHEDDNE